MIRTTTLFLFICALFAGTKAYSQARTGISFGYMFNKPFSGNYNTGGGISVVGNIAITSKWIIAPEIAYDNLAGNNKRYFNADGFAVKSIQNIDLFHLGCLRQVPV